MVVAWENSTAFLACSIRPGSARGTSDLENSRRLRSSGGKLANQGVHASKLKAGSKTEKDKSVTSYIFMSILMAGSTGARVNWMAPILQAFACFGAAGVKALANSAHQLLGRVETGA